MEISTHRFDRLKQCSLCKGFPKPALCLGYFHLGFSLCFIFYSCVAFFPTGKAEPLWSLLGLQFISSHYLHVLDYIVLYFDLWCCCRAEYQYGMVTVVCIYVYFNLCGTGNSEYSFFGRMHALLLIQSFHASGYVVALAQTSDVWSLMLPTLQLVNIQPHFSRQYCCLGRNHSRSWVFHVYLLSQGIVNEIWSQRNGSPLPNQVLCVLSFLHLQWLYSPLGDMFLCCYTGWYWDLMR